MPRKNPAPPPAKTAASNRRKRGDPPEKGVEDLEPVTKRTRTAKPKAKATSQPEGTATSLSESNETSQPKSKKAKSKMTSKSKPKAKVPQSELPRVVPTANAVLPSPHAPQLEESDLADKQFLGDSCSEILLEVLRLQYPLPSPVWADDRVGKVFARWICPGTANATGATADDSTAPVVSETWIRDHGFISWDSIDLVKMPRNSRVVADRKKANAPRARHVVEMFRDNNNNNNNDDEEDTPRFYMRYEMPVAVKVNGDVCTHESGDGNFAIGPLPDYAIIEIDKAIIFWWKNAEGTEYLPEDLIQRKRLRDEEQEVRAATEGIAQEREEWGRILKRGIHDAQARRRQRYNPFEWKMIPEIKNLADYHVFLATGLIWSTRRQNWRHAFAFGGINQQQQIRMYATRADFFENIQDPDFSVRGVVGGPADLILPLAFDGNVESPPSSATRAQFAEQEQQPAPPPPGTEEGEGEAAEREAEKGKGKGNWKRKGKGKEKTGTMKPVGHTVFAVAHRRADGTIETRLMDSWPGYWDSSHNSTGRNPHNTVRKLVERSGWLAQDRKGYPQPLPTAPQFEEVNMRVPQHGSGENSCRIHAILNAWRYMLELPELDNTQRLHHETYSSIDRDDLEESFMNEALLLINLAIAGYMDYLTIQAFMVFHGFCGWQPVDDEDVLSTRVIPRIDADILGKELECDQYDMSVENAAKNDRLMRRVLRLQEEEFRAKAEGDATVLQIILQTALVPLERRASEALKAKDRFTADQIDNSPFSSALDEYIEEKQSQWLDSAIR
ncbi:MAG: hypothetical protein L6R37_006046 [Teloschistes peruensis]|nr:MAG: hypothetical protein L6R37_006046 [Teloschistes peruensis]